MSKEKKGQVNIYFLVSIALFISLSIYLVYLLLTFYPAKGESIRINSLYSKAYTISELMLKDPGYPDDWNENNLERIGLSSVPYEINLTKLNQLKNMCSPYNLTSKQRLYDASGLYNEYLVITITEMNGTSLMQCSPSGETDTNADYLKKRTAQLSRIATVNNRIVEVTIYVG
jgi:hypothetical protein